MTDSESVFEQTYKHYLAQISELNLKDFQETLDIHVHDNEAIIDVFGQPHRVSGKGIFGPSNIRPTFDICIILSKYILLCPDLLPRKTGWVSYRDFKDSGPLLKFYANDVEKPIANRFTGKIKALNEAGTTIGGYKPDIDISYDFSMQFGVLPRIPLLLLFNDSDKEFPAACSVLFQSDAEKYLDAECLSMVGVLLNRRLKKAIKV